jgi:hypothetical protein
MSAKQWHISAWDIAALRFAIAFLILMPILIYKKDLAFLSAPNAHGHQYKKITLLTGRHIKTAYKLERQLDYTTSVLGTLLHYALLSPS